MSSGWKCRFCVTCKAATNFCHSCGTGCQEAWDQENSWSSYANEVQAPKSPRRPRSPRQRGGGKGGGKAAPKAPPSSGKGADKTKDVPSAPQMSHLLHRKPARSLPSRLWCRRRLRTEEQKAVPAPPEQQGKTEDLPESVRSLMAQATKVASLEKIRQERSSYEAAWANYAQTLLDTVLEQVSNRGPRRSGCSVWQPEPQGGHGGPRREMEVDQEELDATSASPIKLPDWPSSANRPTR